MAGPPPMLGWARTGQAVAAKPPAAWEYDGVMHFSNRWWGWWYQGEIPARWLAREQGLALRTVNMAVAADLVDSAHVPADTAFYFDSGGARLLEPVRATIRDAGGRVFVSCDEHYWAPPPWIPPCPPASLHLIERTLTEADAVLVWTARMAEQVQRFTRKVHVMPLALPPLDQLPRPALRGDRPGVRIGWVGTGAHAGDLAMIRPAVLDCLARRPDVTFVLAGGSCELPWVWALRDDPQIELHSGHVYLPAYYRWLASLDLDVFVTPLVDHPWNAVKPVSKPLEAAGLGLPVVASRVGTYADELRHEATALLVENTTEAWLAALLRMVEDADLRAQLATGGRAWAATRTIEQTGPQWAALWGR
jgi:glycosyltransferase involved in cell wall biosynthesis